MSSRWQRLRIPEHERLPPLLFKYTSTTKGYEIQITDLTHIWSERLNFREILQRAEDENTTIDPHEDPEQFDVLLQKIGEALRGHTGSSITLSTGSQVDSLEVLISAKLPAPLRPLEWTLYLLKEPLAFATKHLLFPLLREEADWDSRQRSLLDQLKQKDWVLGKLFDKIETLGLDLSAVFPGVLRTARKETSLSQAAKSIKGVAPFDEQAWLDETKQSSKDNSLAANLLTALSESPTAHDLEELAPAPERWWENLAVHNVAVVASGKSDRDEEQAAPGKELQLESKTDSVSEGDEFERQETPPRLKPNIDHHEETTINMTGTVRQPKRPSVSPVPKAPEKPSKGLGVIGGKKTIQKVSPPPSPTASDLPSSDVKGTAASHGPKQNQNMDLDTETESEPDENVPTRPLTQVKEAQKAESSAKRARGLGVIGGKKKEKQPAPLPSSPLDSAEPPVESESSKGAPYGPTPSEAKPKRTGKLGVIGGKGANRAKEKGTTHIEKTSPSEAGDAVKYTHMPKTLPPRSTSPGVPSAVKSDKEETEQEKAERRREGLKRQLEAKSKAPAKKKRKF